jgi:hypothetical protein
VESARVTERAMFVFFSNQLGCLPSLAISAAVTAILLIVFGVIDL